VSSLGQNNNPKSIPMPVDIDHYIDMSVTTRIFKQFGNLTFYSLVATLCMNRFNTQKFNVLSTQCIYVFCMDLRTNSDYLPN
jgi:hypothetical protein